MTLDDVFDIPADVVARKVRDEIVVLNLESGSYFGLDPVGARIWELIGEGRTLAQVCEAMLVEYDVTRARMERDILRLVATLTAENLVETRR